MMEHIMPDIPRIYTAVAEWMACMLFILPVKKRFQKWNINRRTSTRINGSFCNEIKISKILKNTRIQ